MSDRFLQWVLSRIDGAKLGVEETGKSIGERQQEAKKPEPEKVEPSPAEQKPAETQPAPSIIPTHTPEQIDQMPPYSPNRLRPIPV
jgi:hypothetical protein